MLLTRRTALKLFVGAVPAVNVSRVLEWNGDSAQTESGAFKGTRESLQRYVVPEWFRDAKFGIWAHWGPQSAPEYGDWYARRMYVEGEAQYKYHLEHYGHPSKFGFKDIIPTWKAEKFDAEYLVNLYKRAGAKYFVSMGVHHDNFDLWNSRHTRWNSVQMGPKKDIVGLFKKAAHKHGLKFGVSDHLWIAYKWFSTSRGSDKDGPLKSVPYDGTDRQFADLYCDSKDIHTKLDWDETGIPETWKRHWFARIKDLVDQYEPDLLCCDGHIPFQDWGMNLVAHYYNTNARHHGGKVTAVYTSKRPEDSESGTCALDVERGIVETIWPRPWLASSCIGNWHYNKRVKYMSPKRIIDILVDVVSRNGNLLLNFPLPNNGMLDAEELRILHEITKWMAVNKEAIYETRPWKIFGVSTDPEVLAAVGRFSEDKRKDFTGEDIRFTTKGPTIYAFVMGWPEKQVVIEPLGMSSQFGDHKVGKVELLGGRGDVQFTQDNAGLKIALPHEKPCDYAITFKISLAR